jgi:hypothetical protein
VQPQRLKVHTNLVLAIKFNRVLDTSGRWHGRPAGDWQRHRQPRRREDGREGHQGNGPRQSSWTGRPTTASCVLKLFPFTLVFYLVF